MKPLKLIKIYKKGCVYLRKNWVKVLALILAVAILASVSLAAKKEVAKPKKIVAFLDTISIKESGQDEFIKEYKKFTGIDLEIIQPVHVQYYEKLRLAFAAGELPDVVEIAELNYVNYANEGAFVDLEPYIKKSAICKKIDKQNFESVRVNGKIYGYPKEKGDGPVTYVRTDWLKNLGMKAPTTWDEYYNLLKAFTLNDPDKNGKNDTYGFTAPGPTGDNAISFASNYYRDIYMDASPEFEVRNGKWIDGFSQPSMKGALERFHKVYQEKLIDPEIFTNKTSTCREKFQSGKAGFFTYWYGLWNTKLERDLRRNLGNTASITSIPAIKGSYYAARIPGLLAIPVNTKNAEAAFKYFLDYSHDGGQGQMLFVHGVENVHWSKKDGVYSKLPLLFNPTALYTKNFFNIETVMTPWKDPFPMDERIIKSRDDFMKSYRQASLQPMPESRLKVDQELYNLKNEVMGKVLLGEMTVDQGLAKYKKEAGALGIKKIVADMNAAK